MKGSRTTSRASAPQCCPCCISSSIGSALYRRNPFQWVADRLELEPIKVLEVVTFYPGFRQYAPGKYHIRICRTLSCAMGGSGELMDDLCKEFGIDRASADPHHHPISVSPCGKYSVEFAECLASCGTAPVCLVNDDFYEGVDVSMMKKACDSEK